MGPLLLLKVSLLLAVTLVAARLLNRAPATARHGLWSLVFGAVLLLAPLAAMLPALRVPVPAGWESTTATRLTSSSASSAVMQPADSATASVSNPTEVTGSVDAAGALQPSTRAMRLPSLSTLFFATWLTGLVAAVGTVLVSLFRVRRLIRTATVVTDQEWHSAATTIGAQLGVRHPVRLLLSPHVGTPMAGGVWRPAVFLPRSVSSWSTEHRDIVLAHELAHLARYDPLRHLMTRLALACYWFHPLAWLAAREAAIAREQACDETVLAMGARPSEYARVLLDLAESMSGKPPARLLGAVPMVHRSHLERRLMTILNGDVRPTTRRLIAGPAIGIALLTLSVAAAQPFDSAQSAVVPSATEDATPVQSARDRDTACWSDAGNTGNFMGSTDSTRIGSRTVINYQVGWRNGDRIIQKSFGDLRLCMLAEDAGDRNSPDRPSQWIGRARRVVMEAQRGNTVQRLEFNGTTPAWHVGGATRDFDAAAQTWRDRMLAVLDTTWELSSLHGEASGLHGQISAIQGQRSALQGEISALQGAVSAMQGRISAAQGEESSLQGQISAIQGHVSSLQGAISAQQGAISSLNASRYNADNADRARIASRIADHNAEIARIERDIRDYGAEARIARVQREIDSFGARSKAAAIQAEIRDFDLTGKVAAVERRIAALDVEGKVRDIERQIERLDADRRARQLEDRLDGELSRLTSAISAIR